MFSTNAYAEYRAAMLQHAAQFRAVVEDRTSAAWEHHEWDGALHAVEVGGEIVLRFEGVYVRGGRLPQHKDHPLPAEDVELAALLCCELYYGRHWAWIGHGGQCPARPARVRHDMDMSWFLCQEAAGNDPYALAQKYLGK